MSASRAGSTPAAVPARLTGAIEPVVVAAGYDLEELVVRQAGQRSVLRVVIDSDHGVPLDAIAEVSRALSDVLDAAEGDLGRSPYVLEVTSRGVDRPLTEPRHWRRNVGRLVVTTGADGTPVTGRIVAVHDSGVTLDVQRGGGKGRVVKSAGERTLTWRELGAGHVQIEFSRPAGHRDAHLVVDESGADDEDEDDGDDGHEDHGHEGPEDDDTGEAPHGGALDHQTRTHHGQQDDGPAGPRDDASGGAGRPAADRRRAPRAGRPPRGGRT